MTLDKEQHREILIQLIDSAQIPGSAVEIAYELKMAILNAEVKSEE